MRYSITLNEFHRKLILKDHHLDKKISFGAPLSASSWGADDEGYLEELGRHLAAFLDGPFHRVSSSELTKWLDERPGKTWDDETIIEIALAKGD